MSLTEWVFRRKRPYDRIHLSKLFTNISFLIGLTITLLIILTFYDVLNIISIGFIKLGAVIALILLLFILTTLLNIFVDVGFILGSSTNGAKLIFICLVLLVFFLSYQNPDDIGLLRAQFSDNLGCALAQIEDSNIGKSIFGSPVGETRVVDDVALTVVTFEVIDGYKYITNSGVETINPPGGAKFLVAYIKAENVGKIKKTLPRWSSPLDSDWIGPFTRNEISLNYAGTAMEPHWLRDTVELRHSWDEVKQYPFSPLYKRVFEESIYPGRSVEGWIAFVVPAEIELEDTKLEIRGSAWRLG